jgi:multidrug efflux pump
MFIRKPIFAIGLALVIALLGVLSFFKLPIELYPNIDTDLIEIQTLYPGASAETMQNYVTSIIEQSITGIDSVEYIESSSTQGASTIDVSLKIGTHSSDAFNQIVQRVNTVESLLPSAALTPTINQVAASQAPMMIIGFTSDNLSREQMADYLRRTVEPRIGAIPGVAGASVLGGQFAMRIWLDPNKMAGYGLTAGDVNQAILNSNTLTASGNSEATATAMNINAKVDLNQPTDFADISLLQKNGANVHLRDVADVGLGRRTDQISSFYDGKPCVNLFVTLSPGANPLTVIQQVNEELPSIQAGLPYGIQLHVIHDATHYIHSAISGVIEALLEAVAIVSLVVFLFLGCVRAITIPLIVIPLSLLGACVCMVFFGFSINLLTLLAAVLAIGLVVDDAIVVLENIQRHIDEQKSPMEAARLGLKEIGFPIIAMTLTLVAIYLPIGLQSGLTSKLFSEFTYSLAATVLISGVLALTLSPMMCAKILTRDEKPFQKKAEAVFEQLTVGYEKSLRWFMQKHKTAKTLWLGVLFAVFAGFLLVPSSLAPTEDSGFLMVLGTAPNSSSNDFLLNNATQLEQAYKNMPSVVHQIVLAGIPDEHQILSFGILKPMGDRPGIEKIQTQLQHALNQIPGANFVALVPSLLPGDQDDFPVQFVIMGDSYPRLYAVAQQIIQASWQSGLFLFVKSDLKYDQPSAVFEFDRDKMNDLGIDADQVATFFSTFMSNNKIQQFSLQGQPYDVVPELAPQFRAAPEQLLNYTLRNHAGDMIPLSSFAHIEYETIPYALNQFQGQNAVTLQGEMIPGHSLSEGLAFMRDAAHAHMTPAMSYTYAGTSLQLVEAGHTMVLLFVFGLLVIYLILLFLFQSYKDPLIILLGSVPAALFGAMLFLVFGAADLNMYTEIGLLTLIGLVSKHGILIVKFANDLMKEKALTPLEAVIHAAKLRLRPILMTTAAMFFGSLPLLLSRGSAAASKFDLGLVITTGILLGTLMTLFLLPAIYLIFHGKREKKIDLLQ